ncbi:cold shock domain-containing protein, partial [Staphylococcus epidermidis]|uniref:cold shock domain-containing protein n=1 Tax=Staphylococcus epidermidis TaxID=1282 RepID=UPI0011A7AEB0
MKQPTLKSFNPQKPFPFIQLQPQNHLFLHFSPINQQGYKSLQEAQSLQFQLLEADPAPQ